MRGLVASSGVEDTGDEGEGEGQSTTRRSVRGGKRREKEEGCKEPGCLCCRVKLGSVLVGGVRLSVRASFAKRSKAVEGGTESLHVLITFPKKQGSKEKSSGGGVASMQRCLLAGLW